MENNKIKLKKSVTIQLPEMLQDEYITFIHDRVGILIKRDHKELMRAIATACQQYDINPENYLDRLRQAEDNSDLLSHLVSSITIGETYFFRDKQQVKLLNEVVLPKIIARKTEIGEQGIRIWSAGCSSGEEIYTIVMLLKDILPNLNEWQCCFLASDINIDLLKKGMSGEYTEWSMRSIPESYLQRYFKKHGATYKLDDDIKNRVTFEYINLNTDTYPSIMNGTVMQDLVICRNVLIYFDNEHIKSILARLSKCIVDDGYILLGASDPIAMLETGIGSVYGYPSLFMKKSQIAQPLKISKSPDYEIHSVSEEYDHRIHDLPKSLPKQVLSDKKCFNRNDEVKINEFFAQEKWIEVVALAEKAEFMGAITSQMLAAKATALANLGKTIEAIKTCEESIRLDKMNKEVYFIYALALSENRKIKEAENAFRSALYIDPDFLLCRYQLGLFLIHQNRYSEGIKTLESVIKSASQYGEEDIVPDSNNMKYKDLINVLKNEIELHQ